MKQAGQALRDAELLEVVSNCERETGVQIGWLAEDPHEAARTAGTDRRAMTSPRHPGTAAGVLLRVTTQLLDGAACLIASFDGVCVAVVRRACR